MLKADEIGHFRDQAPQQLTPGPITRESANVQSPDLSTCLFVAIQRGHPWMAPAYRAAPTIFIVLAAPRGGRGRPLWGGPLDLPVQRRCLAVAVLLEAQVDGGERGAVVRHRVHREPAEEIVATDALARPGKTAAHGVVERVAPERPVVAGLQRGEAAHRLEVASPAGERNLEEATRGEEAQRRIARRVRERLAAADLIAGPRL